MADKGPKGTSLPEPAYCIQVLSFRVVWLKPPLPASVSIGTLAPVPGYVDHRVIQDRLAFAVS